MIKEEFSFLSHSNMFYLCVGSTFPIPRHLTPQDAADSHKLNLKQMVNLWTYSLHSQTTGTDLIFRLADAESQQMQLNFFEHALGFPRPLWCICGHAHGHGYTTLSLSRPLQLSKLLYN